MATTYKVLGQSAPSATTATTLYTAGAAAIVSSIVVCNRASTADTFRVWVAIAAAGDANQQYIYYDIPIAGNDTFVATMGVTMANTDLLRVYAGTANLSFSAFGCEIS